MALTLTPAVATAAKVKGTITGHRHLRNPVWLEGKNPEAHGYSFREPSPTVKAEDRKLFPHIPKEVCIALSGEADQKAPQPVLIRVGGGRATPVTIVVAPGTPLEFKNTDPFTHRLYVVGVKTFNASDTKKGDTRKWTVPGPGVYEIRDETAPSLRMWVIAEPKVASIAYPSMSGDFRLSVEEPGLYKLQVYFSGKKVGPELPVEITTRDIEIKPPIKVAAPPKAEAD